MGRNDNLEVSNLTLDTYRYTTRARGTGIKGIDWMVGFDEEFGMEDEEGEEKERRV